MDYFTNWFNENKESSMLIEEYRDYITETEQMGYKPLKYRAWAKDRFINS